MGRLILPQHGAVYVDTNVIIYRVEQIEPYLARMQLLWDSLEAGHQEIFTSELSTHEALIRPLRESNLVLRDIFIGTLYATPHLSASPSPAPS